jgi:RHH-type proline utilization regulon transcriptional repressor/proline dehydrogenase/delta 1-pyrroline-5-carboxylate dehydrogenase
VTDVAGLGVERNLFRYLPWPHAQPVLVRLAEGGSLADLMRVLVAATLSRSSFTVSSAVPLPSQVRSLLTDRDVRCVSETDAEWVLRVAAESPASRSARVRLIGPDPLRGAALAATALMTALPASANLAVYAHPVTQSGRVELLPFVREQALSITAHRFGTPATFLDEVL